MFTGIVAGRAVVLETVKRQGLHTIWLQLPRGFDAGLGVGASVSVDGVCLTVSAKADGMAAFDGMQETLACTTLGGLTAGSSVNVERAARDGAEIGGHPISGHVDCTAEIERVEAPENNRVMTFRVHPQWMRYVFAKGYIAIDGASLTVAAVDKKRGTFDVWLIPETRRLTTFEKKAAGDRVNIEIERSTQVTVDTIRGFLEERLATVLPRLEVALGLLGVDIEQLAAPTPG